MIFIEKEIVRLVLTLSLFLLIEQLLITDGTVAPLNRLRTIYTFAASIALFVFGIGAAFVANRWYDSSSPDSYQHSTLDTSIITSNNVLSFFSQALLLLLLLHSLE